MRLSDRQSEEEPDLNLTSLIDVVFLLLIFFMVTTTFERTERLRIDLPEASEAQSQSEPDVLEIAINEAGEYYVNRNQVINSRRETLLEAVAEAAQDDRSQPVLIRADAKTPHEAVVRAMDVVNSLGFINLSIATTPDGG